MKASPALVAALALAFAPAAYAQTAACTAPTPPPVANGATATLDEMKAAAAAVKDFIIASDAYQQCELESLAAARAAAKAAKTRFDNDVAKQNAARIDVNQAQKVAAGAAFGEARKAYLAAHPAP